MTMFDDEPPEKLAIVKVEPQKVEQQAAVKRCIDRFYQGFVRKWNKGVDLATARATSVAVLAVSLVLTALAGWRLLW